MTETDTCDEMAILRRIPTNCHTTPARQWIVGDRDDDEIDAVDLEIAMLWADHNVAINSTFSEAHPGYHYYVDHHGDLAICRADSGDRVASTDARAELADDLADPAVTVEAILVDETAPEHLRSVGKRIVTDGGEDLIHGGECPVCGDTFADGFEDFSEGESIENVRICVIKKDDEQQIGDAIIHIPEDDDAQLDRGDGPRTDGGQPDLLGYCDRCSSIHRPSEPHKGAVADGGLVAGTETTNAFLRARLATAYRSEGEIRCDGCDSRVDLGDSGVADAIAAWNDHVADCGGEADE